MFFELMRHDLKCQILHKRVAAITFQTAMPSIPVVHTSKRKIYLFLRGVKCYLDTKPEKTRLCLQKPRTSCFAFITFVDSLVSTIMRVFLGAFCIIYSLPQNNWRTICRP